MLYPKGVEFMTGKRAFWLSFGVSLLIIVPAYLALLAYQLVTPSVSADTPQSGIPVVFPTVQDDKTLLIMTGDGTAQTAQGYTIVRLDALHEHIAAVSLPRESIVLVGGAPVRLCGAVQSAGPTQGLRALEDTLGVTIDNYLFASPETLWTIAEQLGTARLKLNAYVPRDALERLALSINGVDTLTLSPRLFAEVLASGEVPVETACELRACGYAAFLAAGQRSLAALPGAVRSASENIATDLTATQLYDYERLLGFLQGGESVAPESASLSVTWTSPDTCELTPDAPEQAQALLGS